MSLLSNSTTAIGLLVYLSACSSSPTNEGTGGSPSSGTGGSAPLGGSSSFGGAQGGSAASGGTGVSMGGALGAGNGGTNTVSGGASNGGFTAAGSSGAGTAGAQQTGGAPFGGAGTAGAKQTGGAPFGGASTGGAAGSAGRSATGGAAGAASGGSGGATNLAKFSFFVTSQRALIDLSKNSKGFGGNLSFDGAKGIDGADKICTAIAEKSMPGSGTKVWRAFLSTTTVHAIDRVGMGPWYDRKGRLIAQNVQGLLQTRPAGDGTSATSAVVRDLPNEDGAANQADTGTGMDDNHDTVTASNTMGKWDGGSTCDDWTRASGTGGPRVGHSWPAQSGMSWIQAHNAPGCAPSVAIVQMGIGTGDGIGNGGGYGGFYCLALAP